jgi:two-component system NtrC family sensor kinase
MMPGMDGLTMLRAIREDPRTADIPAIMLTAKNQVEDRLDARQAGADVYLAKPFSPPELRASVMQLLQRRGRQVSVVMREQVKSLEIISAGLAHEIHNPLSRVKSALFVIDEKVRILEAAAVDATADAEGLRQKIRDARQRIGQMWDVARKGVDRIEQVVQVVKGYAAEGHPRELVPVSVDKMLSELAPLVSSTDGWPQAVRLELGAGEAQVLGIPAELEQVFRNLWSNAADATGETGHIWTKSWCDGSSVFVEVADDGPGIAPELMQRIFTPFFTTKDPGKGMGLGLAIAHQVVTQAGGDLDATSVVGEGTRFRVRLPVAGTRTSYA